MGIVNGNPMGMGISMVGKWEWEWEWQWLYGNGREWESERHSRTPLPGTAQFFRVPPIISGTGKATEFKFGRYIQNVHPNKSPLKL